MSETQVAKKWVRQKICLGEASASNEESAEEPKEDATKGNRGVS